MAKFKTGSSVNPFYRSSQAALDLLESADAPTLALSVPFVKLTQVDPYNGTILPKPAFHLDLVSPPAFGRPSSGMMLERPLVSLESLAVKSEAQVGMAKYEMIDLNFVVHDVQSVFFGNDDISTFRALLQEGNSFLLEYGWRANCKNDLLNGIGFYDADSGYVVPAINRMRIVMYTWNASIDALGEMKVSVKAIHDGELALREAKLSRFFDLSGVEEASRSTARKRPRAGLSQQDSDAKSQQNLMSVLDSLPKVSLKPHGDTVKLIDVLNAVVAPAIESSCLTTGYAGVDLFLGNFSTRCANMSQTLGGQSMSDRSVGEFIISLKQLKTRLGALHALGETIVLRNFIELMANLVNEQGSWTDDREGRTIPEIFIGTATRTVENKKLNFVLFFADRNLSKVSDGEFDRGDLLDPNEQSRAQVLGKIKSRGIPVVQFGKATSIIKDCSFSTIVDDQMRGVFVDEAFKARKNQAQVTSLPDSLGRKGRARPEDYTFFSGVQVELTMLGNFIFTWGQTNWLDIMNIHPISGLYDVVGIEDTLTATDFTTKIKLITRGTDPLNTRRRKTKAVLEQERLDVEEAKRRR